MRKDKAKRHAQFVKLITTIISEGSPQHVRLFEGAKWAAISQWQWATMIGCSDRTVRDLAKHPPIIFTKTVNDDGKPIVLYRFGYKPHISFRSLANEMAAVFCKKHGLKRIPRRMWGMLNGLAEIWPDGVEVEVFKSVLKNFKEFRAAVKIVDPDSPHFEKFYEFVSIALVRKYHAVALEVYINQVQASGKTPHPSIKALNPKLWPNLTMLAA